MLGGPNPSQTVEQEFTDWWRLSLEELLQIIAATNEARTTSTSCGNTVAIGRASRISSKVGRRRGLAVIR